jgi:hypothetical protein
MLLVKIVDKKYKRSMAHASLLMSYKHINNKRYKITSRVYDSLKSYGHWNKGLYGYTGHPQTAETKQYLQSLYKGVARSESDKQRMRDGWIKLKELGYSPWNKGKLFPNLINGKSIRCYFISPSGIEYEYNSMRQGCIKHNLPTSKMCEVNTGKLAKYKGWSVRKVNL